MAWHARILCLPVLGNFIQGVDLGRFVAALVILSASSVSLITGLDAAARTIQNYLIKLRTQPIED